MTKLCKCNRTISLLFLCLAASLAACAQTVNVLDDFTGSNGSQPYNAVLFQGTDGNFYGTTQYGGANNQGTLFRMTPSGTLTTLYSFSGPDGAQPLGGLIQGLNGQFYGVTVVGGANTACYENCGTVFEFTSAGKLITLHSFDGSDGNYPWEGLVQASDGNFYGTTSQGGTLNVGTIFKITPEGVLTTLHSFDLTDGDFPAAPLIQGADGALYGTTESGAGDGNIFKITLEGAYTVLAQFNGSSTGEWPRAGLFQSSDGMFYGCTTWGGRKGGGTVFRMSGKGVITVLASFQTVSTPVQCFASLTPGTDGNIYGTTFSGGSDADGTIFQVTPAGAVNLVYSFPGEDGGSTPWGLIQGTDGLFYGITWEAGMTGNCCGVLYSFDMGLGPFITTQPASGKAGSSVIIRGTNLTGASSVSFNGTAAKFKVVSSSEIMAAVPPGATSGTVQVETSARSLSSNMPFRVNQ